MSEREALERFHNWRAARGRDAESHRPPRSNRVVRITVPFSIAITALGLAAGFDHRHAPRVDADLLRDPLT
jgi:hypothetical protein